MSQLQDKIANLVATTPEFSVYDITQELRKQGWQIAHQTVRNVFYDLYQAGQLDQYNLINSPRTNDVGRTYNHYSHPNVRQPAQSKPTPAQTMTDDEIWDAIEAYLERLQESATAKRIQSRFKKWHITCAQIAEIAERMGGNIQIDATYPSKSILAL